MKTGRESGHMLMALMITTAVVSTVVGVAVISTGQTARLEQRTRLRDEAIAVGDAHLEWAFAYWRNVSQGQRNTTLPASSFSGLTTPPLPFLSHPERFTVTNYVIHALNADGGKQSDRSLRPAEVKGQGVDDTSYFYLAEADVSVSAISGPVITTKVRRVFEKNLESPWKYAIAYLAADRPALELHPGPIFTVNGWVHSNGALYISPDGGNPLNFLDKVTSVDSYFQGYMNGNWQWRSNVRDPDPKTPGPKDVPGAAATFTPGMPWAADTRKDAFGIVPSQFDPTDNNPNNDSYRELIERPAPGEDPLTDSDGNNPRFYNTASVRVLIDGSNNVTILNSAGQPVTSTSTATADRQLNNAIRPAITTNQTIQDNRETASVRLATLDISKVNAGQVPGWNGVIYISDTSAGTNGSGPKRGIRLRNGTTLPNGGLTVVSDNPVYVQGNFNTNTNRQPAAIIGDAIVVLSNNWSDSNSTASLSSRKASDTTINAAFLSGIVPTNPQFSGRQAYSGGVENFPRFLESWTGRTFTYNGSMVQLFYSQQATGRWGKDNVYDAPNRNWAFDVNFRTNPPPGTLFTTTYRKHRWYIE